MNANLIEKLIKSYDETCPEPIFTNPLLNKSITRGLSKSLIKTLNIVSKGNCKNESRKSILKNIRKVCKIEPEGHMEIDDNLTEILISSYQKQIKQSTIFSNDSDKELDSFLVRNSQGININSVYQSYVNPEVAQAMLNLSDNDELLEALSKDIIFWNIDDIRCATVLEHLWDKSKVNENLYNFVSIKIKSKFENALLHIGKDLLKNELLDINNIFTSDTYLISLVNASSISPDSFQICIGILNYLFVATNFNSAIERFISSFIKNIKLKSKIPVSVLYPACLSNIVILLDIKLDELPMSAKQYYIKVANEKLKTLHDKSENDLIMLLSHYPIWFDIYFKE